MSITLRPGTPADAAACGQICYDAFRTIATHHGFPPDLPSPEAAIGFLSWVLNNPRFYSVVAEVDGRVVGSNFLDERAVVSGVGPITVDPTVQNRSVGRQLMQAVLDRAAAQGAPSVRLLQAGYHARSLALYTRLGFAVREPVVTLQGDPLNLTLPGYAVRPATDADLPACDALCRRVHGFTRGQELRDSIVAGSARVVEHGGRIVGYASDIGFIGHAVGESNDALKALIGAHPVFFGPGFLVPMRNAELFQWCLARNLRVVQTMTLMSVGMYSDPALPFMPSVLY